MTLLAELGTFEDYPFHTAPIWQLAFMEVFVLLQGMQICLCSPLQCWLNHIKFCFEKCQHFTEYQLRRVGKRWRGADENSRNEGCLPRFWWCHSWPVVLLSPFQEHVFWVVSLNTLFILVFGKWQYLRLFQYNCFTCGSNLERSWMSHQYQFCNNLVWRGILVFFPSGLSQFVLTTFIVLKWNSWFTAKEFLFTI